MGLMTALNAAVSGLRTTQDSINLVSQNVANANSVGYTRRIMSPLQQVAGDRTVGVRSGEVQRVLDTVLQKQLRLERAGAAYTDFMAGYALQLDKLFGTPGGAGSLDTVFNTFTQSLQALLNDAGDASARATALSNAGVLASHMGSISESIQALRSQADGRIGLAVDRANELLSGIADVSARIVASQPVSDVALLDERDRMIDELSQFMDIQTFQKSDGSVTLSTTAGLTLFNGITAMTLSFDGGGTLSPQSLYSTDPAERSVGTIKATAANGVSIDVIGSRMIRSGEIAAAIEMRDQVLVQAQRQLDELAAGMARALSDKSVVTSDATGHTVDFTGMQPGNSITLDYRTAAGAQRVILVAGGSDTPVTLSGADLGDPSAAVIVFNPADDASTINSQIGADLAARGITVTAPTSGTLHFANGGSQIASVSATATVTSLSGDVQLPFFIDGGTGEAFTGSFEGLSQLTGFAQRIAVNPALLSDPETLVKYAADVLSGDTTRPQFLLDALTKTPRSFSAANGLSGNAPIGATVSGFVRRVVEHQGANAETAARLHEGQSVALAAIESRFAEGSSVNIDQEMAQLVTLQMAYGANARVMTAVRDMMDMLMRM